ncbi:hypothetical protein tb265_47780 [Gemmatimonadetes bacterium T265]|nr:hypothetical protein tb265_47780 [Gemmatimonadetes bacterium T265]
MNGGENPWVRALAWIEDRSGLLSATGRMLRHPVPPRTGWRYVFGSATLVAFAIQVVTGTVLATVYAPSAAQAYPSLQWITHAAAFGRVLRGLHYFGASAMVVLVAAHMARVFLTASYKYPREIAWLTGVGLLFATLAMAFTGQLLRWDQDAIWSAVVAAEQAARVPLVGPWLVHLILGGSTLGAPTLTRAFATHVFALPAAIFALVGVHLWLVLRNGISEPPEISAPAEPGYSAWYRALLAREGRPFWPDVAWRDAAFGALVVAAVLGLALAVGPVPLGRPPDPTLVDASPRPDWYFLWYFAALAELPRRLETPVMVLGPLAAAAALLALPFVGGRGSRHLRARRWAPVTVGVVVAGLAWLTVLGDRAPWSPRFGVRPVAAPAMAAPAPAVAEVVRGAQLFHDRGCEYCHMIGAEGGIRGPDLTHVAERLNHAQIVSRILGGAGNMPAYAANLAPGELDAIVAYLTVRARR